MTHFNRLHLSVCVAMMAAASLSCAAEPALAQDNASQAARLRIEQVHPNETYTGYYNRRRGNGAALAAGAVGLAAGAILGGALANQAHAQPAPPPPPGTVNPQVAAYCARTYRSYDPVSGTYLASNGLRYVCTYP
jgi:anti-sigma factor RsiW